MCIQSLKYYINKRVYLRFPFEKEKKKTTTKETNWKFHSFSHFLQSFRISYLSNSHFVFDLMRAIKLFSCVCKKKKKNKQTSISHWFEIAVLLFSNRTRCDCNYRFKRVSFYFVVIPDWLLVLIFSRCTMWQDYV